MGGWPGLSLILRRLLLARLVDRDVLAMRQWRAAVGDDERVELDETMAFLLVIAGDACARRQLVAATRSVEKLHPAADMNPRAQDGVVDQHPVHDPLQQAGMAEPFTRTNRIALAHIGQVFRRSFAGPGARHGAEPSA